MHVRICAGGVINFQETVGKSTLYGDKINDGFVDDYQVTLCRIPSSNRSTGIKESVACEACRLLLNLPILDARNAASDVREAKQWRSMPYDHRKSPDND